MSKVRAISMGTATAIETDEGFCVKDIYAPANSSWYNQSTNQTGYIWFDETGDGEYHFVPKKYYNKAVRLFEVIHFRGGIIEGMEGVYQVKTLKNIGFVLMQEDQE